LFLSSLAAFLTKETAVVLPALIIAFELLVAPARKARLPLRTLLKLSSPVWAALLLFLAIRFRILHGVGDQAAAAPLRVNLFTAPTAFWLYLRQLVWPVHLSEFYPITVVAHFSVRQVVLPTLAIALLASLYWLWARRSPVLQLAAVWYAVTLAPVIAEFSWVQLHDRHLYLPSFAVALMVAVAFRQFKWPGQSRPETAQAIAAASLGIVMTLISVREAQVWNSDLTAFTRAVEVAPANTEAVDLLATAFRNNGSSDKAEATWLRGLEHSPASPRLNLALGSYYYEIHNYDRAALYLRRALKASPRIPGALFELGIIEWQRGDSSCAGHHLAAAVALRPTNEGYRRALAQITAVRGEESAGGEGNLSLKARSAPDAECSAE
jgi:Flp pilus assembly protein TadD